MASWPCRRISRVREYVRRTERPGVRKMTITNVERKAYTRVRPCLLNGMLERRSVEVKHVSPLLFVGTSALRVATPRPLNARTCPTKINQISANLGARNLLPGSLAAINCVEFDGRI